MIQIFDAKSEHEAGVLCEQGFMKERYDNRVDELMRTFTSKGIAKIKEILKDPEYKKAFMIMLANEIKDLPIEYKRGVIFEIQLMLL